MVENPVREGVAQDGVGPVGLGVDAAKGGSAQLWLGFVALALVFFLSFTHLFMYFWQRWTEEHGPFGYGYFVPPCVGYLLWANRKEIAAAPARPGKKIGWVVVGGLVLIQLVGLIANVTFIQSFALIGLLVSIPYCLWGPDKFKFLWAPMLYFATMVPWPGQLTNPILFKMQHISIVLAFKTLSVLGLGPVVDGTVIGFNDNLFHFEVAPACAGLTILFPTVACSILTVMMLEAALWRKLLYVCLSIPVSILTNAGRISLVGIIGYKGNEDLANRLHDASGFVGVIICVIVLSIIGAFIGCAKYKDQFMPSWAKEDHDKPEEGQTTEGQDERTH